MVEKESTNNNDRNTQVLRSFFYCKYYCLLCRWIKYFIKFFKSVGNFYVLGAFFKADAASYA